MIFLIVIRNYTSVNVAIIVSEKFACNDCSVQAIFYSIMVNIFTRLCMLVINVTIISLFRDCIDEDYIKTLFASTGGGVQNFRFFQYVLVDTITTVFCYG